MPNFFWDERRMEEAGFLGPTILAIGDSWFWYLFYGGSLINQLGPIVAGKAHVILAKGMNGAEARHYVDGKYEGLVTEALRRYGAGLNAVFISGGGNDFAGLNDLRPLLKDDCRDETTARGCFIPGNDGLDGFMDDMDRYYRSLIRNIRHRVGPECHVVMHPYDYAIPNGRSVASKRPWLQPALLAAQVPGHLHAKCIELLLNRFRDVLDAIRQLDPVHYHLVDSLGTLRADEWANELHPTPAGFKKIAHERWKPLLQRLNLAD
ncbi:MAG: SGNH/GDSL hydrolase family protein [Ramlibacter sp.]|nr:SGNH/GDSL hydrolase family protein [Ramlibacter sp.]